MSEAVGGVMAALKMAAEQLRRTPPTWTAPGDPKPYFAVAEQCDRAISDLEAMLTAAPARQTPPALSATAKWAAQVEGLRFGLEMGVQAEKYAATAARGGEWEGPIPPGDLETAIAAFRGWLASRG